MSLLGDDPREPADAILDWWIHLARRESPWSHMYLDDIAGEWRSVVIALLIRATSPDSTRERERLAGAARSHGEFRRRQRCPPQTLGEEVALLEVAIGEALRRDGAPSASIHRALRRLGPDLRSIGRAVHAGYVDGPSVPKRSDRCEDMANPEE